MLFASKISADARAVWPFLIAWEGLLAAGFVVAFGFIDKPALIVDAVIFNLMVAILHFLHYVLFYLTPPDWAAINARKEKLSAAEALLIHPLAEPAFYALCLIVYLVYKRTCFQRD